MVTWLLMGWRHRRRTGIAFAALVVLGAVLWYDRRENHRKDATWEKIRTEDAVSDTKQAEALHMLAEDSQRKTEVLREIKTILDERLARRV